MFRLNSEFSPGWHRMCASVLAGSGWNCDAFCVNADILGRLVKPAATRLTANRRLTSRRGIPPGFFWQTGGFYDQTNQSNWTENGSISHTLPCPVHCTADWTYRVFPVLSVVGVWSQGRRHFAECEPNGQRLETRRPTMHRDGEPRFTLGCRPISRNYQDIM